MARDFSAWSEGISSLGKNDKGESYQKVVLKKWNLEALRKERPKVSPLGPPRMGKSAGRLLKREPQKNETMKNEERTSHQCC